MDTEKENTLKWSKLWSSQLWYNFIYHFTLWNEIISDEPCCSPTNFLPISWVYSATHCIRANLTKFLANYPTIRVCEFDWQSRLLAKFAQFKFNTVAWVVELTYLHVLVICESLLGGHGKARCTVTHYLDYLWLITFAHKPRCFSIQEKFLQQLCNLTGKTIKWTREFSRQN